MTGSSRPCVPRYVIVVWMSHDGHCVGDTIILYESKRERERVGFESHLMNVPLPITPPISCTRHIANEGEIRNVSHCVSLSLCCCGFYRMRCRQVSCRAVSCGSPHSAVSQDIQARMYSRVEAPTRDPCADLTQRRTVEYQYSNPLRLRGDIHIDCVHDEPKKIVSHHKTHGMITDGRCRATRRDRPIRSGCQQRPAEKRQRCNEKQEQVRS